MSAAVDYEAMKQHVTVHEDEEKPPEHLMDLADTHGAFACVKSGVVANVIVIDTADIPTVQFFKSQYDDLVLIQHPGAGSPGIGWTQPGGPGTALQPPPAPASISATPASIPPDGATFSTVVWTAAEGSTPPAQITFTVNGASTSEPVTNGVATVEVTSNTPGDTITVSVDGLSATVQVTV